MKNLLSENMLRFGTKNLSEAAQRELVLKSIMETINEHGLHNAVRSRLTEADAPENPKAWIEFNGPSSGWDGYKTITPMTKRGNVITAPYVIQSGTSLGEASAILGGMLKAIGNDDAEGTKMQSLIKQITKNNYPAILWKVRNGSTFKSSNSKGTNFHLLADWLSNYLDASTASNTGTGNIGSGGKGPVGTVRDFLLGTATADAFNSHMDDINRDEKISTARY